MITRLARGEFHTEVDVTLSQEVRAGTFGLGAWRAGAEVCNA